MALILNLSVNPSQALADMPDMNPSTGIDLVSVLSRCSYLLRACLGDDLAAVRCLRLVNREARRVALLGLRNYTLTLKGEGGDTNVSGATLLQQTKLTQLTVYLRLTGRCELEPGHN